MGVSIFHFLYCVLKMAYIFYMGSLFFCHTPLAMVCYTTPNDIVHAYTNTNLTCVR